VRIVKPLCPDCKHLALRQIDKDGTHLAQWGCLKLKIRFGKENPSTNMRSACKEYVKRPQELPPEVVYL